MGVGSSNVEYDKPYKVPFDRCIVPTEPGNWDYSPIEVVKLLNESKKTALQDAIVALEIMKRLFKEKGIEVDELTVLNCIKAIQDLQENKDGKELL